MTYEESKVPGNTHPKEYGKDEVALVKEKIRKRGRETNDNPHVPFGEITSSLSESAVFASNSTRPKMMYKRQLTAPPNPRSLEELQLNPDEIKTYSNKSFCFATLVLVQTG